MMYNVSDYHKLQVLTVAYCFPNTITMCLYRQAVLLKVQDLAYQEESHLYIQQGWLDILTYCSLSKLQNCLGKQDEICSR